MFTGSQIILNKTVREHIGGRWAISFLAFAINAPINLASIFSNASASSGQEGSARWWIVAVVGYAAFGAVLWLASSTAFRNRGISPVPIWWVVGLGFVAGGVRGLVVGLTAQELDLASGDPNLVVTRIATGAFMGAVLFPIAALVFSIVSTYRHERARLIEEQVESEQALIQSTGMSEILRGALLESVQSDLGGIRTSGQARELSHRIWETESDYKPPALSLWRILRTAVTRNPYASVAIISFWSVSSFGSLAVSIGPARALFQIIFSAFALVGIFWLGRRLNQSKKIPGFIGFLFVMGLSILFTSFIASWIFDPRPWPSGAGLMLTNAIWLPTLTILFGIAVTAVRSSESVIEELRNELTETELIQAATERETDHLRRELATQLHGSIQSRLLITAALFESPEMAKIAHLSQTQVTLDAIEMLERATESDVDVNQRIASAVKAWNSLMTIELNSARLNVSPVLSSAITRVVEEGLSNAYRHGKAQNVLVTVEQNGPIIEIRIDDNGLGVSKDITHGLGMRMIETMRPTSWSLTNTSHLGSTGCQLRVEFKLKTTALAEVKDS